MKFSCSTKDLLINLAIVSRSIGTENVLPILQNILIHVEGNQCTLSATNLELSIITTFKVSIENEGSITIPAKAILNFVQYNQDPEILLETSEGTQLKISSKRAKAVISGEPASGFPTISTIDFTTNLTLPTKPLLQALHLTTFSCAKTTSRPVISGVFIHYTKDKLILVGTDSYRLSEYKIPVPKLTSGDFSCIIPSRFLEELKGIISHSIPKDSSEDKKSEQTIEIHLGAQQVEAIIGSTRIMSRLIDGKFPDYLQVLPKERKTTSVVNTKDLLSAVKRMHYFAKEQSNNITCTFEKSSIHLKTKQTQMGSDEATIIASLDGEENKIAISSTYLIDFLSRIESSEIVVELSDKQHPAVFKIPADDGYLHLIMPLRMNEE